MNEIVRTNNLSFYNDHGILTISAKQYDTGRKFIFNILDNEVPFDLTGCLVYLRMQKADNTQFQGEECCLIEGNRITVDTSIGNGSQILSCPGSNICELHITDVEGNSLTTWDFIIDVMPRVHSGEHVVSTDSFDTLDNITENILQLGTMLSEHANNKENPHATTAAQLGLDKVENKSSETIRDEITKDNVTTALGYVPYTPTEVDKKLAAYATSEALQTLQDTVGSANTLLETI